MGSRTFRASALLAVTGLCVGPARAADDALIPIIHLAPAYAVVPDVTYATAGGIDLKLDVYKPRDARSPRPTVVHFHGGGWVEGSKDASVLQLLPYLEMGWSAVSAGYRLARQAHAPAAVEDCRCALRWVVRHAREHGFDPARIVVTGGSAGGHLALAAGLITGAAGLDHGCPVAPPPGMNGFSGPAEWEARPAAIVNWFGITDVSDLIEGANARRYAIEWLGVRADREAVARLVSPLTHVQPGRPPVITIHGDADTVVPYGHAVRLHDALRKAGVPNRLVTIPGGGHGGFTGAQVETAYAAIRAFLEEQVGVSAP